MFNWQIECDARHDVASVLHVAEEAGGVEERCDDAHGDAEHATAAQRHGEALLVSHGSLHGQDERDALKGEHGRVEEARPLRSRRSDQVELVKRPTEGRVAEHEELGEYGAERGEHEDVGERAERCEHFQVLDCAEENERAECGAHEELNADCARRRPIVLDHLLQTRRYEDEKDAAEAQLTDDHQRGDQPARTPFFAFKLNYRYV